MPEDQYFRPRNWAKFQSRSNNSMAWVKVQTSLLSDPDFAALTENQRLTWLELLLLTGRTQRPLPLNSRWIGCQLTRDSRAIGRALPALLSNGFIELCERTANLFAELPSPREEYIEKKREEKKTPISPLDDDLIFGEFWSLYPRQRRGAKQNAFKAWQRAVERAPPGDIILGLRAYRESDEVRRGFAKGAAAWLNDDRWTTDYRTFRTTTPDEQLKDWVDGNQGDDSGGGTIDGECVEVPESGRGLNGGRLLPRSEGSERRGRAEGNGSLNGGMDEDEPAQAGGYSDNRRRLAALAEQVAKATKA